MQNLGGRAPNGSFFEAFLRDGNDANLEIAREKNGGNSASELIQFPVIRILSNKICRFYLTLESVK